MHDAERIADLRQLGQAITGVPDLEPGGVSAVEGGGEVLSQTTTCAPVWYVVAMLPSRDVVAVRNGRNSTPAALRVSAISTCTQAIAPPRKSPAEPNCRRRY